MNVIYINKSVIKKVKRDNVLIDEITKFLCEFNNFYVDEDVNLKYIIDETYRNKLAFKNRIIFDILDDFKSIVLWNIGDYSELNTKKINGEVYNHGNTFRIVEGNQFIRKEIKFNDEDLKNLLNSLIKSENIELEYFLDSTQTKIEQEFNISHKGIQAISGAAGSGKTLILHRLAYKEMKTGNDFLYIAFTNTLKSRFKDFIYGVAKNECIVNANKIANIYTYEEFLRDCLSPMLNINPDKYITFEECEKLKNNVLKNNLIKKDDLGIHDNELVRMIMSILVDITIDSNDNKVKAIVRNKINKLNSRNDINLNDKHIEKIAFIVDNYKKECEKERKLLWGDFIRDIKGKINKSEGCIKYKTIFIDEMQDLSQNEYNLILQLIENNITKSHLVLAYDENQRISFEGSSIRNLRNRISDENTNKLIYSYRNSYNIFKLSNKFISKSENNIEETKNINSNKVKILVTRDIYHVINTIRDAFIPEEDLNIGVLAFGNDYNKYKNYFVDEFGRSRFVGIDFFDEETIKGLEFSNLIILNFMGIYNSRDGISDLDFRKWYVGITRASENLMIHFLSENEIKKLNELLLTRFNDNFTKNELEMKEYINIIKDNELAFEEFKKDLLISLAGENKSILLNEGKKLIEAYADNNDNSCLMDAINLFYKLNSLNSLISLLKSTNLKNKKIIFEIIKAAILLEDIQTIFDYIHKDDPNEVRRLISFALKNNKSEVAYIIKKRLNVTFDKEKYNKRINNLIKEGNKDIAIKAYFEEELFDEIILLYKNNKEYKFSEESKEYIGKSYKYLDRNEEAINLFLKWNNTEEAVKVCEVQGDFKRAYTILKDSYKRMDKLNTLRKNKLGQKLIDTALKINSEKYFEEVLRIFSEIESYKKEQIYFKLYLITNDISYLVNSIELYYEQNNYEAVIRCYEKENDEIKENRIINIVAISYEECKAYRESADLYKKIQNYSEAARLLYKIRDYLQIIEIYKKNDDTICNRDFAYTLINAYDKCNKISSAVEICLLLNDKDRVIKIYCQDDRKMYSEAEKFYLENKNFEFKNSTYEILEYCMEKVNNIKELVYICDHKTKQYGKAIELYYFIKESEQAVQLFDKLGLNSEKNNIKKVLYGNTDVDERRFNEIINNIADSYYKNNEMDKALDLYLILNNKNVANKVVEIYYKFNRYNELISYVNKMTAQYTKESQFYIGDAYEKTADYINAINQYLLLTDNKEYIDRILNLNEYLDYESAKKLNESIEKNVNLTSEEQEQFEKKFSKYIERDFEKRKESLKLNDLTKQGNLKNYVDLYLQIIERNTKLTNEIGMKIFEFLIQNTENITEKLAYNVSKKYYIKFPELFNNNKYELNNKINKYLKNYYTKKLSDFDKKGFKNIEKQFDEFMKKKTDIKKNLDNLSSSISEINIHAGNINLTLIKGKVKFISIAIRKINKEYGEIFKLTNDIFDENANLAGFDFDFITKEKFNEICDKQKSIRNKLNFLDEYRKKIHKIEEQCKEVSEIYKQTKKVDKIKISQIIELINYIENLEYKKNNKSKVEKIEETKNLIEKDKIEVNNYNNVLSIKGEEKMNVLENPQEDEVKQQESKENLNILRTNINVAKKAIKKNYDEKEITYLTDLSEVEIQVIRELINLSKTKVQIFANEKENIILELKIQMIKNAINENLNDSQIARITNVSEEGIQFIKNIDNLNDRQKKIFKIILDN